MKRVLLLLVIAPALKVVACPRTLPGPAVELLKEPRWEQRLQLADAVFRARVLTVDAPWVVTEQAHDLLPARLHCWLYRPEREGPNRCGALHGGGESQNMGRTVSGVLSC